MRARSLPSARATRVASRATASRAPPSLSLARAPRARSGRFRRHPPSRPPRALPDADVAPVEAWQLSDADGAEVAAAAKAGGDGGTPASVAPSPADLFKKSTRLRGAVSKVGKMKASIERQPSSPFASEKNEFSVRVFVFEFIAHVK